MLKLNWIHFNLNTKTYQNKSYMNFKIRQQLGFMAYMTLGSWIWISRSRLRQRQGENKVDFYLGSWTYPHITVSFWETKYHHKKEIYVPCSLDAQCVHACDILASYGII